MLFNLSKLMDINMISHTKAPALNLGSTERMDFRGSAEFDGEKKIHFYFGSPVI